MASLALRQDDERRLKAAGLIEQLRAQNAKVWKPGRA
jgi:hypothetical protein